MLNTAAFPSFFKALMKWLSLVTILNVSISPYADSLQLQRPKKNNPPIIVNIPADFPSFTLSCSSGFAYSSKKLALSLPHYLVIEHQDKCDLISKSNIPLELMPIYEQGLKPELVNAIQVTSELDLAIYENRLISKSKILVLTQLLNHENNSLSPLILAKLALYYKQIGSNQELLATLENLENLTNKIHINAHLYYDTLLLKAQTLMIEERYEEAFIMAQQWSASNTKVQLNKQVSWLTILGFTQLLEGEKHRDNMLLELGFNSLKNARSLCTKAIDNRPKHCLAEIYNGLATYYRIKKDFKASIEMLISAIRSTEQNIADLPDTSKTQRKHLYLSLSDYTNNLAIILDRTGSIAESQHLLRRSLFYNIELNDGSRKAIGYKNLAKSYQILGNYDLAERYYAKSLAISQSVQNEFSVANIHLTLLKLEISQGKYNSAKKRLSLHSESITKIISSKDNKLLAIRAHLHASTGEWQRALELYRLAYDLFEQHPSFQNPDTSLSLLKAGITIIESSTIQLIKEEITRLNNRLIEHIKDNSLGSISNSFEFERLKNKMLIEKVMTASLSSSHSTNSQIKIIFNNLENIVEHLSDTLNTIDGDKNGLDWFNYSTKLLTDISPLIVASQNKNLWLKLWQLSEKIDAAVLIKQRHLAMAKQDFEYYLSDSNNDITRASLNILSTTKQNSFNNQHIRDVLIDKKLAFKDRELLQREYKDKLSINKIMQKLASHTALIKYLSINGRYYVFWITTNEWGFSKLELTQALITQHNTDPQGVGGLLEQLIPHEILKNQNITQLLVKPSASLHNIAFASLKGETHEYLTDKYSITRIPSASMYFSSLPPQKYKPQYTNDISVFMDPNFGTKTLSDESDILVKQWLEQFSPLPWTRQSKESINEIFDNNNITILAGNAATKEALLSDDVRRSKLLHIATHAYYHPKHPDLVGLVTSSSDTYLGYVSLDELLAKPFYSKLVVLSACETQMGTYYESHGSRGLAYSFLAQGADSVIGTLWKIPDKPTAVFMRHFYQALKDFKGDKAKALQQARLKMKRSGRYKSQIYWAGFVLTNTHYSTQIIAL